MTVQEPTDEERDRLAAALTDHEIGRIVGRGQFGVVWSARHLHLGRQVAVKRLDELMAADPEHAARFRREARTLAQLDHRHVVAVHDYREIDGMRLLIMELLAGGTLADRRSTPMRVEEAVASTMAAACGLHHVHAAGVLHRDIKPENLMFDRNGVLKVTDFGLARGDGGRDTSIELSRAGTFFGTPAYVAPEQAAAAFAEGWPEVSETSDQYSLAAVLYEALSGQFTHDPSGGGIALCTRRLNEEARPLVALAPDTPPAIASVVMRAVARDPAARYPDAEEFAVDLGDATTASLGPGWLERSQVGIREPGAILDSAARPAGGTKASPVAPSQLPPPPAVATVPPADLPHRPRVRSALVPLVAIAVLGSIGAATWWWSGRDSDGGRPAPAATEVAGELPLEVTQRWATGIDGNVFASPTVAGDLVLVGDERGVDGDGAGGGVEDNGALHALDRSTGEERWRHGTGGAVSSSAAVEGDVAVVGSRDGNVHAVSLTDGEPRWTSNLGAGVISSPAIANGVVVAGAKELHGLDLETGDERWVAPIDPDGLQPDGQPPQTSVISSPVVADRTVIVGTVGADTGELLAVDLNDGSELWRTDLGSPIRSSPHVLGDRVYVGTDGGRVVEVSVADGAVAWSAELEGPVKSSPLVTEEQVVVGTEAGDVVALDRSDGSERWSRRTDGPVVSSPAAGDGWVIVGSNDTIVYVLGASDGELLGRFETGGIVPSSPHVDEDGVAYVGSYDSRVYALEVGDRS